MSDSMFPHTVTLYHTERVTDKQTFEDRVVNFITVLTGVLCSESKANNIQKTGLTSADTVNLYIPFDVTATDGLTGKEQVYIDPTSFARLEDKSGYWTVSPKERQWWFVKGEALPDPSWPPESVADRIKGLYDSYVYTVTTIDRKDYGGLAHIRIGAS